MGNHRPATHHWQTLSYEKPPTCSTSLTNFIIWETTDLPHITDKLYHMRNHRPATHLWQNFIIWETTDLPHITDKLYHMRNHRPAPHHWQTLSYNDEYYEKPPTCHTSLTNFIIWETTDLPHITDKLHHIMMSIMRNHRPATHHWQTLSYEKPPTCRTSLTNFII